jgi:hypothetical protein
MYPEDLAIEEKLAKEEKLIYPDEYLLGPLTFSDMDDLEIGREYIVQDTGLGTLFKSELIEINHDGGVHDEGSMPITYYELKFDKDTIIIYGGNQENEFKVFKIETDNSYVLKGGKRHKKKTHKKKTHKKKTHKKKMHKKKTHKKKQTKK